MCATATIRLRARVFRANVRTLHHFLFPRSGSGSLLASKPGLFLASAEVFQTTVRDDCHTQSAPAFKVGELRRMLSWLSSSIATLMCIQFPRSTAVQVIHFEPSHQVCQGFKQDECREKLKEVEEFASSITNLILDINGYFAP
jgi:hypothetical protein